MDPFAAPKLQQLSVSSISSTLPRNDSTSSVGFLASLDDPFSFFGGGGGGAAGPNSMLGGRSSTASPAAMSVKSTNSQASSTFTLGDPFAAFGAADSNDDGFAFRSDNNNMDPFAIGSSGPPATVTESNSTNTTQPAPPTNFHDVFGSEAVQVTTPNQDRQPEIGSTSSSRASSNSAGSNPFACDTTDVLLKSQQVDRSMSEDDAATPSDASTNSSGGGAKANDNPSQPQQHLAQSAALEVNSELSAVSSLATSQTSLLEDSCDVTVPFDEVTKASSSLTADSGHYATSEEHTAQSQESAAAVLASAGNSVYGQVDGQRDKDIAAGTADSLDIPQVVLTEASVLSLASSEVSSFEMVSSTESAEGRTRLLEYSATETDMVATDNFMRVLDQVDGKEELDRAADVAIAEGRHNNQPKADESLRFSSDEDASSCQPQLDENNILAPTQLTNVFPEDDGVAAAAATDLGVHLGSAEQDEQDGFATVQTLSKALNNTLAKPKPPTTALNSMRTSSPICHRSKSPSEVNAELPSPVQRWKDEFVQRIALKQEQEVKDIHNLKETARKELEDWYSRRQAQISAQHSVHLDNEQSSQSSLKDTHDNNNKTAIWERMANLAVSLPRFHQLDEKCRDVSRMKSILLRLKNRDHSPRP